MTSNDSAGRNGSSLPPPKPPALRKRHRYHPDDFRDGVNYVSWPASWAGRAKHPPADRSNRLAPWGYDDATGLVIAPWGISPVSGTPRLTPPTNGSMRDPRLNKSPEPKGYAFEYGTALNRQLTEIMERRFAAWDFDPFKTLVDIARDPKAKNGDRVSALKTLLPFIYPRLKSTEIHKTTETTQRYVIEIPAADTAAPLLDLT